MAYLQIPEEVWEDDSLTLEERTVLGIVWGWQGRCEYSYSLLAAKLGCGRPHAIRIVKQLINKGLLSKEQRYLQSNRLVCAKKYTLLVSTEYQGGIYQQPPQYLQNTTPVSTEYQGGIYGIPNITNNNTNNNTSNERVGADAPTTPSQPHPQEKPKRQPKPKNLPFPTAEEWEEHKPKLAAWAKGKVPNATDKAIEVWIADRLEEMEGSVRAKPGKYAYADWVAAFQNWNRKHLDSIGGGQKAKADDRLHMVAALLANKARINKLSESWARMQADPGRGDNALIMSVLTALGGIESIRDQLINAPASVIERWIETFKKTYRGSEALKNGK